MEKEGELLRQLTIGESDILLQWGSKKRLRCQKVAEKSKEVIAEEQKEVIAGKQREVIGEKSNGVIPKKIKSRVDQHTSPLPPLPPLAPQHKNSNGVKNHAVNEKQKSGTGSSEKEERYYITRGSLSVEQNGKNSVEKKDENKGGKVWPRLLLSLTTQEKEEDFLAMKGCKLPQKPKKRPKFVQKNLLMVTPGAWLTDLCQERYEVREKKKRSKKRPRARGLKAMGFLASDSD